MDFDLTLYLRVLISLCHSEQSEESVFIIRLASQGLVRITVLREQRDVSSRLSSIQILRFAQNDIVQVGKPLSLIAVEFEDSH